MLTEKRGLLDKKWRKLQRQQPYLKVISVKTRSNNVFNIDQVDKELIFYTFSQFLCCRRGVVIITTIQLLKPEFRLCAGSNLASGVSEICDGENLWQWSRLEIGLTVFHRSTIPQKQFIIIDFTSFHYRLPALLNSDTYEL